MKIKLALILSVLMMFSSIQEGVSQLSSMVDSKESCCASKSLDIQDDMCDLEDSQEADSCCEGSACDCTCCIHISLFNTSFSPLTFQGESAKDIHTYKDTHGHLVPFPIFHPPLFLI